MKEKREAPDTWRSMTHGPILAGMDTGEAIQRPDRPAVRESARGTEPETGEGLKTFLIADVRGYTLFTHERGDEAAANLASRFAEIVREEVNDPDGSVVELRGDEGLAVFRSPRGAIKTAVELQARFLQETATHPDLPLPVGIGLDVGEAVVVEGGYRGGALNLAGHLCSEARPGEILATQSLVHLARTIDGIRYHDRGELHLKGLSDPVRVLAITSQWSDVAARMRELAPKQRRRAFGSRMQLRILGPLEVDAGSGPIPLGGPRQRAVLAHLIVRGNELIPAETLVDELWGEEPPERARNIIQTYISNLRRTLGGDRIEWRSPGYVLRVDRSEVDAARFDALVREAKKALSADAGIALGKLEDALSLWRGPALAGLADQPLLLAEATRLDHLRLEAQEARVDALLATGAQARAIGELEVLLAHHPLRESLWGRLMLALYRDGRQGDALAAFQRARKTLADELGIDPSSELARLHERILRQDPALDLRGEQLRGYRLLERLFDGPRGTVFRAIQPRVERDVVVKIFHEAIALDAGFVRRFEQEAQAAAALEHPHIVPIYDYWREPGRAYIVSRYLRGGTLETLEERGQPLGRDRGVHIIEQVASALAYAHGQRVAHGSLGSSNVLFDGEGNAYLGDFVVGIGPPPDPPSDVRELARLAKRLLGDGVPGAIQQLCERCELGADVPGADAFAEAARAALLPTATAEPQRIDARNPYKGLRPFSEADSGDFFGRAELIQRLVARLREGGPGCRVLAVIGPSGSGKSSVVRAGLVPAIRHGALGDPESFFIAAMTPGARPMEALEAALLRLAVRPVPSLPDVLDSGPRGLLEAVDLVAPADAEVVLVIDQFEEAFNQWGADGGGPERFLESLRVAAVDPKSRLRVVLTLRADFYDRPLTYPRFGELLAARTEAVPPLTADELEQAIRRPAEQVGVTLEPGLVAEMIAEVAHQPGALPLLQYALTELFERREDDRLTLDAHREVGGVAGALSARADHIVQVRGLEEQRAIKQVFLRLVTLGEGTPDTRRRVPRSELDGLEVDPAATEGVLEAFGRHRFLTFDRDSATREPTVEIAHEALLTAWGRLRNWIEEAREDLRQERRLSRAAAEWRGSDRDPSFLLRGARLEQVAAWDAATDLAIGHVGRAYLKSSIDQRDREKAEEDERRRREARMERRSRTRLRALVAVFAVAALITGSLTIVARNQSRIARARELASAAIANLDSDPERSILLATAAVDEAQSADGSALPEAEEALHRAVIASRVVRTVPGLGGKLDWSPSGIFVTEGPEGSGIIDIRDAATGQRVLAPFRGHEGDVTDVAFSADGSKLATTGDDGWLKVWDPSTGDLVARLQGSDRAFGPSFSADGSKVAAAWTDDTVQVLDLSTDRVVWTGNVVEGVDDLADTSLSPDGEHLAVTTALRNGAVFDLETGEQAFKLTGTGGTFIPSERGVSWSPDGRSIATTSADGIPRVWDARSGKLRFKLLGHTGFVESVAWSPDSSRLVTGGTEGTVKIWDIGKAGLREVLSLSAQEMSGGVRGVAFSADGTKVMAGGSAVKIWDVGPNGDAEWGDLPSVGFFGDVDFMPNGLRIVASSTNGARLKIWDVQTRKALRTIALPFGCVGSLDVSPDGRAIAAGGGAAGCHGGDVDVMGGDVAGVWDAVNGEERFVVWDSLDVNDVAFSPDGDQLVTAGWDRSATIIDRSGHTIRILSGYGVSAGLAKARFSADGRLVATVVYSYDNSEPGLNSVEVWDWADDDLIRSIPTVYQGVVDFGPTGPRLVMLDRQGRAEIMDAESGRQVAVLAGQLGKINDIAFSPDGSLVATAGDDGTVRLFEAETGAQRLALPGDCGIIHVAFSSDGTKLASASNCGVRIWAVDIDDLLQIARQNVTRSLTDEECRKYLHEECSPA
jgi:WD40 repeat protein/DNA-binding SARP family transcriptional activator/class 3 adenylate cyclase